MEYISIASTVVTFVFAAAVFIRYRERGGTHLLLWGIGLVLYGLGTLCEALLIFTYSEWLLKTWYLCGGMLTAAWLGQGTVHLLVRKRNVAKSLTIALTVVSLIAFYLVFTASIQAGAPAFDPAQPASGQYKEILGRNGFTIALTIILNTYGAITLIGGAIYSAYIFWRKGVLKNRMIGNILIAIGAMMPATAGTLIKLGVGDWLYVSELLGVVLMYIGFLQATAKQEVRKTKEAPAISGS